MGRAVETMPGMHGVGLTRADGRYILVEEDAAAVYYDEHACFTGYLTVGRDPRGSVDAYEWGRWGLTEDWATGLATLLGGEPHQSGGGVWVVLFQRADGKFAVIGADGAEVYRDRSQYERYYEPGEGEPERVGW